MNQDLLQPERQDRIATLLAERGKVLAADLAERFGVSEDTIRRDLRDLSARGLCERVHGGALAPGRGTVPMAVRMGNDPERKAALADAAAPLIAPRSTLFIDAGSTNLALARALPEGLGLTVFTNAPDIALALADHADTAVIVAGGRFDPHTRAILGARTAAELDAIRPDLAVIGVCGLSPEAGLTAIDFEDGEIKRRMAARAGRLLVAATNDKFGLVHPWPVAAAAAITLMVAEHDAPEPVLAAFAAAGTKIHRARPVRAQSPAER